MVEQAREIVRKFNKTYGNVLIEPKILLPENQAGMRLPGIDGKAKMSKSLGNCIYLSDSKEDIKKKVMSMYTDPTHLRVEDSGHIEGNTVFTYLDAFCEDKDFQKYLPEYKNLEELKSHYKRGGLGDVKIKRFLNDILEDILNPIRERRDKNKKDIPYIYKILKQGTEIARKKAKKTLLEMKEAMKINYFENDAIIEEYKKS